VLLEAVRSLPADMPVEVKVYGELEQFPEYVRRLRALAGNDERIAFCGTFPNKRIGEILYGLDVLVIPSVWYENTPLTCYFAQAAGVPVVATDTESMREVVADGINGFLFPTGDVRGLAGIIRLLCIDRAAVRRLSDHARKPKTISSYVDELERMYDEVVNPKTAA
jgi:glycosyltransferase involved in cell wall biosynthesis